MGSGRGGLLVWAEVSQAMLAETGAHHDMDDGLPSYLIDIDGAAIAVLFKEQRDGTTRASIRTAGPYDAAGLAAHFGGGGHVRAAGCSLALGLQQAKATVLDYAQVVLGASTSLGNHS
jgi:phosphoesterase RecJ-like protein